MEAAVKRMDPVVKRGTWKRSQRILAGGYALLVLIGLYHYVNWWSAGCIAGLAALVLSPAPEGAPRYSYRYGVMAIVFFILFLLLPVKTLLYFSLAGAIFFFRECFYGKMASSGVFVVLLGCPIVEYVLNLFSFPIRLGLTSLAGGLLQRMGSAVVVNGNMLQYQGNEFSVDPACMGLHMLLVSLMCGLLLINLYQGRYHRRLRPLPIVLLLILILALNVIMNLLRVMILVLFCILPANPLHGILGICCLVLYVLFPLLWICRRVIQRHGLPVPTETPRDGIRRGLRLLRAQVVVAGCMVIAVSIGLWKKSSKPTAGRVVAAVAGYSVNILPDHVLQLHNRRSLVYLKFIPDFYYTDHQPTICWQGSGWSFQQIKEEAINGQLVYTGVLQNGKETLYTAWWYDNGVKRTLRQLTFRWDVLRGGHPYSIVNITAASRRELEDVVLHVLKENTFCALF